MMKLQDMGIVKIAIKAASGSTLTETTKQSIIDSLKPYNVLQYLLKLLTHKQLQYC